MDCWMVSRRPASRRSSEMPENSSVARKSRGPSWPASITCRMLGWVSGITARTSRRKRAATAGGGDSGGAGGGGGGGAAGGGPAPRRGARELQGGRGRGGARWLRGRGGRGWRRRGGGGRRRGRRREDFQGDDGAVGRGGLVDAGQTA